LPVRAEVFLPSLDGALPKAIGGFVDSVELVGAGFVGGEEIEIAVTGEIVSK
jgi:hypothetical protein